MGEGCLPQHKKLSDPHFPSLGECNKQPGSGQAVEGPPFPTPAATAPTWSQEGASQMEKWEQRNVGRVARMFICIPKAQSTSQWVNGGGTGASLLGPRERMGLDPGLARYSLKFSGLQR